VREMLNFLLRGRLSEPYCAGYPLDHDLHTSDKLPAHDKRGGAKQKIDLLVLAGRPPATVHYCESLSIGKNRQYY